MKRLLAISVALALSGCAMVGPDYERPGTEMPTQFDAQAARASETAVAADWWKVYGDETLNELIIAAFANNADLQGATARVEELRSQMFTAAENLEFETAARIRDELLRLQQSA